MNDHESQNDTATRSPKPPAGLTVRAVFAWASDPANAPTIEEIRADEGCRAIAAAMEKSRHAGHPVVLRAPISPITARWLLYANECNRNFSETKAIQYSSDAAHGRWVENGDGMSIATTGALNNGQHRCAGVIHSDSTIMTNVTVGVTRESRTTNDIGLPRTLSNVLTMDGVQNPTIVGAMTRLIIGWEDTGTAAIRPARENSCPRIQRRIASDPGIARAAQFTKAYRTQSRGVLSVSQLGFLHYVMTRHSPDAERFLAAVATGTEAKRGLDADDPRYILRSRLQRDVKRLGNAERVELVFKTWNAWRTGGPATRISINGTIPALAD